MSVDTETLRAWRRARGLTAADAAKLFGVSLRTLEGLEQGRSSQSPLWGPISVIMRLLDEAATSATV